MGLSAIASGATSGPPPGPAVGTVARRFVDFAVLRQRLRPLPQASQAVLSGGLRDRPDEPLALLVLLELEVHPGQPHDRPLERRPTLASFVEPGADVLDVGHEIAAHL